LHKAWTTLPRTSAGSTRRTTLVCSDEDQKFSLRPRKAFWHIALAAPIPAARLGGAVEIRPAEKYKYW
jgi:hypothetical protein